MLKGYEKLKTVGKGAFGTASLYRRIDDGKQIVLKEILIMDLDEDEKKSALNEIDIISNLHHPNIIQYLGNFVKNNAFVIMMEFADGGNLAQLINSKKNKNDVFSINGVLNIFTQICSGISYMHSRKILHRDLKTANVFVNLEGIIKIGDFGISKKLSTKSQASTVVGTPYYLSPEMCEGNNYNEKSDIWAMGCILYELICLKKPFEAPTLPVLVQRILTCEFEDIPLHYTRSFSDLVHMILQKNHMKRPTAKYLLDFVLPSIEKNANDLNSDSKFIGERSVLYKLCIAEDIQINPLNISECKIISFSKSATHKIAVTTDSKVYCWGDNTYGQLAQKNKYQKEPFLSKSLMTRAIVGAACGLGFSIFLNKSGNLFSCGKGSSGCLGHGDFNDSFQPSLINTLITTKIIKVTCGENHCLALSAEGKVFSWGFSGHGALGQGFKEKCNRPHGIVLPKKIKDIFCGENVSILLSFQGQIFVAGDNKFNKLLTGESSCRTFKLVSIGKIKDVGIGHEHCTFLTEEGKILVTGSMAKNDSNGLKLIALDHKIIMVSCGESSTVVADEQNVIWAWGRFKRNSQSPENDFNLYKNNYEIKKPESILALYSSKNNLKEGNYAKVGQVVAGNGSVYVLVNTTSEPSFKNNSSFSGSNFTSQSETAVPLGITQQTELPNMLSNK